jgi:hypothetical protein
VRAAPRLDLGAAAGVGRDLWDEPCEQWVRVPDDAPVGSYVSLRVVGESMDPLLHTGDSVLVQVGSTVARDTVVLARVPDGGYVVKKVGKVTRAQLELQSLNEPFRRSSCRATSARSWARWCCAGARTAHTRDAAPRHVPVPFSHDRRVARRREHGGGGERCG